MTEVTVHLAVKTFLLRFAMFTLWKTEEEHHGTRHRKTSLFLCCFDFLPLQGIKQAFVAPNAHFCSHIHPIFVTPLLGRYRVVGSTLSPNNNVSIDRGHGK